MSRPVIAIAAVAVILLGGLGFTAAQANAGGTTSRNPSPAYKTITGW